MPKYISAHRAHERERFYKYVNAGVAKIILVNRSLRWSSPLLFNDPFDVPREVELGFSLEEIQPLLAREVARIIENPDAFDVSAKPQLHALVQFLRLRGTPALQKKVADELRRSPPSASEAAHAARVELQNRWAYLLPRARILSLSELNDSSPMWSHYAEDHHGIVIELECNDLLDSPWLVARPVTYQDTRPTLASKEAWVRSVTGQQPLDYKKLFSEFWYLKTSDWAYEKEWRVVTFADDSESGLYADYGFDPRDIRAVYVGAKISEQDLADIRGLLSRELAHVSVYRALLDYTQRSMRFERLP